MDVTRTPEWYNERVNDEARQQWAARTTGVKCAHCGGEIVAVNEIAYEAIVSVAGRVELPCQVCARERM